MHHYLNQHKPTIGKKEADALLSELRELHRIATMKNANFFVFDPQSEKKMDELRELTKIWRTSYLLAPLANLIERYERFLKGE